MSTHSNDPLVHKIDRCFETSDPFPDVANNDYPISVVDFINQEIPDREDLIGGGLLPRNSIAFVSGRAKIGKSLFVTQMGICLATGSAFLLRFPCTESKVLYVQQEISEVSMQDRLRKQIQDQNTDRLRHNFHLINAKGLKLDNEEEFEELRENLSSVMPDVMILDPFYKLHSKEENSASDMQNVLCRIDELIDDFGISVIIVHHHGKPSEVRHSGAQRLRGSSALFDYGDSYFVLQRKSEKGFKDQIKLSFEFRNAKDPGGMILNRDSSTLWYKPIHTETEVKVSELDVNQTFEELEDEESKVTKKDLVERLMDKTGAAEKTVERRLKKMKSLFNSFEGTGRGNPIYLKRKIQNDNC